MWYLSKKVVMWVMMQRCHSPMRAKPCIERLEFPATSITVLRNDYVFTKLFDLPNIIMPSNYIGLLTPHMQKREVKFLRNRLPGQTMDAELNMSSLQNNQVTTSSQETEKMWWDPVSTHYKHNFFQPDTISYTSVLRTYMWKQGERQHTNNTRQKKTKATLMDNTFQRY